MSSVTAILGGNPGHNVVQSNKNLEINGKLHDYDHDQNI